MGGKKIALINRLYLLADGVEVSLDVGDESVALVFQRLDDRRLIDVQLLLNVIGEFRDGGLGFGQNIR